MTLIPLNIPAGVYRNGTDLQSEGRWRDANLVRWHDGVMRPVGGWRLRSSAAADAPLRGMLSWVNNQNNPYTASGTFDRLYVWNAAGLVQDITPSNFKAGRIDAAAFTGFGGGFYGLSTYGTARPITSRVQPATSWHLQPWGEYLVALSADDGKIYEWDLDVTDGPELVNNPEFTSDTYWIKGNANAGNSTSNWSITGGVAAYAQLIKLFDAGDDTIVDATADAITIPDHGFGDGDEVTYTVPPAPAKAIDGLVDGTNYFIVGSTANTIQLAATSGGAAIDLIAGASLTFDADDVAVVDTAADKIVEANTFTVGDYVTYDNGGGTDIGGLTNGANYYIVGATASEFQLSLTPGGAAIDLTPDYNITFDGDDAAIVDVANDKIIVANTFTNGDEVTYTNGGGVDIGGLTDGTNYFVINASATEFQLSATSGGAAITLTANNSVTVDAEDALVVDVTTDVITIANTFTDGEIVTYSNGGGTDIDGLVDGTDYYIISASATDFQVSLTSGGAAVDLIALGTGTAHVFRQDIGSSHNIEQDIGSAHVLRVDVGADHEFTRVNYGNLEQTVSGLNNAFIFDADDATIVDVANDKIVIANTFSDDDFINYNNNGGVDIGGLVDGTSYYVVNSDSTEFQLSATKGGTPITLTANNEVTIDSADVAVVEVTDDKIIIANTFSDGDLLTYSNGGGTDIDGLVDGQNYYVINATASEFQLSLTLGGTAVDILAVGAGASHVFRQDIGSKHDFRNTLEDKNTHAILVTLIDPNDDSDPATLPSVTLNVVETETSEVLIDEPLEIGVNRFHFDTFESDVRVKIIPDANDTPNFDIDDVKVMLIGAADLIETAPTDNLGIVVTEERFLFALGAGGNPRKLQWCDRENNKLWTPENTNEAGDIELNTAGQIMAGCNVNGQTLLLTSRDAHVANYVGPPYVYGIERVGTSCGLVASQAFSVVDAGCFWMGVNSFYQYTGSRAQELPSEVSDYVFNDINRTQISKVFASSNSMFGEVWWFYASGSSIENDRYVVFNYIENTWHVGELSRTAGCDRGAFPLPQFANPTDYKIYEHEVGFNYDSLVPFAETGPIKIGSGEQVMRVTEMIPDEKTQGDVSATFKTRFYPNGTERTYGPYDMSNPTSIRFTGRQIRLRVEGDQLTDWRVGSNRIEVMPGGRR